jgi:exonuclease VII small subunit
MKRPMPALLCVLAIGLPMHALGADAVTDAMAIAYAPYRAALFATNGKSKAESEQALAQARQAWQTLSQRYAARPPAPYDRDPRFADTLAQVESVYARAADELRDEKPAQAHETLEAVRDLLAALRRRNDVIVFSDHMNAYHARMEQVLRDGAKAPASQSDWMEWMASVGTLDYLASRLRADAPARLLQNAAFEARLREVEASVVQLRAATLALDAAALRDALAGLKRPYSRLFLAYG